MKLYYKFLLFILALVGVSLWAGIYFPDKAVKEALSTQITDAAAAQALELEEGFCGALASGGEAEGLKYLYAFKERSGAIYAGLISPDHKITAHTNVALAGSIADLRWLAGVPAGSPVSRRVVHKGEEIIEWVFPLKAAGEFSSENVLFDRGDAAVAGFVWAGLSLAVAGKAERDIVFSLIWTNVLTALFALLVSGFFVRLMLRQVGSLGEGIRRVRAGDLTWQVKVESRDEIGGLAVFFNEMLGDLSNSRALIEDYQAGLERKVEERTRELEKSQESLVQASKMAAIGQMVSGVAHELNNPLAGIMGYAQVMLQDDGLSARQREDLGVIVSQSGRAKEIIQTLLQFSRKSGSKTEVVRLPELIEGALKLMNYEFSSSGIKLEQDIPRVLPQISADPSQLQQVFLNIAANARDAMTPGGGTLRITAAVKDGRIALKFSDTGPGISKDNLDRIFDPFFTTKPSGKGTGLGLSISYEIVKNHKGRLVVESEPGKGSVFIIELPAGKENA
ncbi:MAG: hypothetical protein A2234_05855 [Elusimicrobia bacterium RIFOXYA2_FULL_58_8]|nr:MAG: hypothetical protein A2234_05855 [Elusimicrobia bacterium RIFOXYA2_FULL_58_8]OGS13938.1 MAG: hypothetical protein A2285_02635 [Elusimicrobia bacterium RIFOXYA12_FULL_57_11]